MIANRVLYRAAIRRTPRTAIFVEFGILFRCVGGPATYKLLQDGGYHMEGYDSPDIILIICLLSRRLLCC